MRFKSQKFLFLGFAIFIQNASAQGVDINLKMKGSDFRKMALPNTNLGKLKAIGPGQELNLNCLARSGKFSSFGPVFQVTKKQNGKIFAIYEADRKYRAEIEILSSTRVRYYMFGPLGNGEPGLLYPLLVGVPTKTGNTYSELGSSNRITCYIATP